MNKVSEHKGVAYFKDRKDAEAHMKKFAPKGRIVEYERGYAVQIRISGPYLNKSGKEDKMLISKFNPDLYWCIVGSKMKWKNNLSMGEDK